MSTRRTFRGETTLEKSNRVDQTLVRIWGFWLVGLLIGAIGIKPSGFSAGGLSVTFDRPEIIQGVIYLASLVYSLKGILLVHEKLTPYRDFGFMRGEVWRLLPKGTRSLRGKNSAEIAKFKGRVRSALRNTNVIGRSIMLTPAVIILYSSHDKLLRALKLVFGIQD
jgi:hypothetical protein